MKTHLGSFAIALITAMALTSTPAIAQHRGGGHGGGWHGGGRVSGGGMQRGGGRVSSGGMQRGGVYAGAGRHINSGRTVFGRSVQGGNFRAPLARNNAFVPSRRHFSGSGFAVGVGVGIGAGAYRPYRYGYGYYPYRYRNGYYPYRYRNGYYPYSYSYYPYSYDYYPYSSSYPAYYGSSSAYTGEYVRGGYASLRLVDVPRDAEVYVDGAYAGINDNSDGVFQILDLTPGSHQIEIRAAGFEPVVFEVRTVGGDTITYRARMTPYSP